MIRLLAALPLLVAPVHARANPLERQPDENGRQVWHSRHFRLEMTEPLAADVFARVAGTADATADAVKAHPLPLYAPPADQRPRIVVCGSDSEYENQGGAPGSAGFFVGRGRPRVLINALHLEQASREPRSRLVPRVNEDLIVHEIVHLCMHRVNPRLPQWFQEGIAEYFASGHQGGGRFDFSTMDAAIRGHLQVRLAPDGAAIPLVRIAKIADLDWERWLDYMHRLPAEERYRAYATSLLLTHYFLHGPERREKLREVLERERTRRERPAVLIGPDEGLELEKTLIRYWQNRGLKLAFPETADD